MIENSVVSWPPCWVALDENAPPTLPCNAPYDEQAQLWTVPGDRMKAGRVHRIPLAPGSQLILTEIQGIRTGDLFSWGVKECPLNSMALLMLLRRLNIDTGAVLGGPLTAAVLESDDIGPNALSRSDNHFWMVLDDQFVPVLGGADETLPFARGELAQFSD